MRVGAIGESFMERLGLVSGVVPTPFVDSWATFIFARTVMVAVRIGLFDALEEGPLEAPEIAQRCGTDARGTTKLLGALAASGYVELAGTRYALTALARKWLLASSPQSLRDVILLRFVDWEWLGELERFVRTGAPVDMHARMSKEQWGIYQRGMRALARTSAAEVIQRTPVPKGATALLDVGGSHGLYSVAFCRQYPALRATVLDLPEAVAEAAPLLAEERIGDRVVHRVGNAITDDFGTSVYDVVLFSQVVHLFRAEVCRDLVRRAAGALRPGGHVVIFDIIRPPSPTASGQGAALMDLYFALVSESGTWSFEEMASWQRDAGLTAKKPIRLMRLPGLGIQVGVKR
ncbi:MAG TPA: class I SAM-dependent methyltransferase [Candidatus Eisenbacteria bacterium]|nr:class I SAM-dependent methyltransferase [Candidatus Eisenbacteria bacterium]